MEILKKIKTNLGRLVLNYEDEIISVEKFDEAISPNMRALRLSMSIADCLLSMGIPSSDVTSMALDVTDRYCQRKVQVDVSSTQLLFSQDRGNDREPLTLIRAMSPRSTNDQQIQAIQELVRDIHKGQVPLEEAEERLDEIYNNPNKYPLVITTIGSALISAGVGLMVGASPIIVLLMFLTGAAAASGLRLLQRRKMPAFFSQAVSAGLITITAGIVAWLSNNTDISLLYDVNPGYIVVGGIIMLVAGLAIVGAVQDAIDEFYITANARLLKVAMLTAGIVVGVLVGIYINNKFGVWIDPSPAVRQDTPILNQYLGAMAIAGGYALSNHSRIIGVIVSGIIGAMSWFVFLQATSTGEMSNIAASGIAAAMAGVIATLLSRFWRIPSTALTTAGIIPLVPGLLLFNGLMEIFVDSSTGAAPEPGTMMLLNALFVALAIAGGASFGTLLARPVRRTLIRARNRLPRQKFKH